VKYLEFEQLLPLSLEEAWSFFSSPANLNKITPDDLDFRIIGSLPDHMYQGMLIRYKIKPMLNIPVDWVTEITMIKDKSFFIDEQRKGPYKIWHHEHHFKAVEGGVLMTDKLYYDIGMGFIGTLAGRLWVDKQVEKIFTFRKKRLNELFHAKAQK
jgi:ligand-binding SRPBCC domain-containing protein